MPNVEKYTDTQVRGLIAHYERAAIKYKNEKIDPSRSHLNKTLSPKRKIITIPKSKNKKKKTDSPSFQYYKKIKSQSYVFGRKDLVTGFAWCIEAPRDLADSDMERYFLASYKFLAERYGEQQIITAVTHFDEDVENGRPHLHCMIAPVVSNPTKKGGFDTKFCCKEIINRAELIRFHRDFAAFIKSSGFTCTVYTGVTKAQGGNRTIEKLKERTKRERQRDQERQRAPERTKREGEILHER
jgi:hypothetical protein